MEHPNKKSKKREFDFRRYAKRHVSLLVAYLGWDYDGLVVQESTQNTIEEHLFKALEKTKLIESRSSCGISRCGRTDKGVSALHQVIAVTVRSALREGLGVSVPEGHCTEPLPSTAQTPSEHCYPGLLNRCLPKEIRVLAWAAVPAAFSARHDCTRRVYKYLLPAAGLDLEAMRSAARLLIGPHDFRHFAKAERGAKGLGKTTERTIFDVRLDWLGGEESLSSDRDDGFRLAELTVEGSGFLWHMIRCIVAVLLAVGEGHEKPEVIRAMLAVGENPAKPQYALASELPLCLFHAQYEGTELSWDWDQGAIRNCVENLQEQWAQAQTKASMIRSMLERLPALGFKDEMPLSQHKGIYPGPQARVHHAFFPPNKSEKKQVPKNGSGDGK